jgi:L-threonylcarbamoyladenylate synthase
MELAAGILQRGGLCIYPTETLYALGAGLGNPEAVARVQAIKKRDPAKPLPLIVGSMGQLSLVTPGVDVLSERLIRAFWPGPLSILLPARPTLPEPVRDSRGLVSLRLTSHPVAQALCLASGQPLVATSANLAGEVPASRPDDVDARLLDETDAFVVDEPLPAGGPPSTVVVAAGVLAVRILRRGAVSRNDLERAGFEVQAD